MIKAVVSDADGGCTVILGITGENITRLLADEPILIDCNELTSLSWKKVALIAGKTEDDIAAKLNQVARGLM